MDKTFLRTIPKAELHLHLEGSLEPELMFALAKRNRIDLPFSSIEDVRAAYNFTRLQDFLDIYYRGADVLRTQEDFYDLTIAYLQRSAADGVCHAELFFDPQTHTARGIAMATVIGGISAAQAEGAARFGITSQLILSFLRHLSEADAFDTLAAAEPFLDRICAVGLDSSERGNPPEKFARVFARARDAGLKLCAHAGEEGPAEYVRQALDVLHVDRIDHGNNALDDAALVARLAAEKMTLTVCPLSNLKLCVVSDLTAHPLRKMLAAGLRVTVNADDPAYFGGYAGDNFIAVADALDLTRAEVVTLARNSFLGSFLPQAEIARHIAAVDAFAA